MNEPAQTSGRSIDSWLYLALGFVGGYGDAAGFVLARAFTGHATGNLVLGAVATAAGDFPTALSHLSAVAVFLTGVFVGAWVMRLRKSSRLSLVMVPELILIISAPLILSAHLGGTQTFVMCRVACSWAAEWKFPSGRRYRCSYNLPYRYDYQPYLVGSRKIFLSLDSAYQFGLQP